MSRAAMAIVATVGFGCSSQVEPLPQPAPPTPHDANTDGITVIGGFDPSSGLHLDDDGAGVARPVRPKNRPTRPIDVVLKSSPTGATAAVDGVQVGLTPAFWFGESDGREHEFTFVLRGYAVARYRFVPVSSGVVHARLEHVTEDHIDAGAEPVLVVPRPDAVVVAPPATVLTPDAATAIDGGVGLQP